MNWIRRSISGKAKRLPDESTVSVTHALYCTAVASVKSSSRAGLHHFFSGLALLIDVTIAKLKTSSMSAV